jgi:hypothetical protein
MLYTLNGALFDYEKLDVYRVELAFIAWIADFLGDVAQSWVLVFVLRFPNRSRPYSWSEVIHRAGDESIFPAFERERPRIVNNFAVSASSGYEFSSCSEKMNPTRLSNLAMRLE